MAQQPRTLHPDLSPLHLFGARLRTLRVKRGLSQTGLGALVFCSGHLIGKIEKAERRPQPDLVRRCDEVLDAQGTLLALSLGSGAASATEDVIAASLPHLRRLLDTHDIPDDGPVRPLPELRADVQRVVGWRLNSNYDELAKILPALLPELHRAYQIDGDPGPAVLLTQAYRAADAIADKFGLFDLSARIIALMRATAAQSEDPLTAAAAEYVRTETFFATGDWPAGRRMLDRATTNLLGSTSPAARATYGTLQMRAAVLAARDGDRVRAQDHIDEAAAAADDVAEGVYRGTAFGTASVRIHQLSLALDFDDVDAALKIGEGWSPPTSIPAERRSHFYVDLARAHVRAGRMEGAIGSIQAARQIAPQHARHHSDIKATISVLTAGAVRPSQALLELARWVGVIRDINRPDAIGLAARSGNQ